MPTTLLSTRRLGALVLTVGLTTGLAACGADTGTSASGSVAANASADVQAGAHNAADVMFAQMMIPHHEQAVEMAQLAQTRASNPQVKALAAQIEAAQGPEIATMKSWLSAWGEPTAMAGAAGMGHGMSGAMSESDMTKLAGLTGGDFDREFLTMMTVHHRGAIEMAQAQQANGEYEPAKKLATDIIQGQSAEIETMTSLLAQL